MSKKKSDITAKITCIIIAIFLWSFVMSKEDPPQTRPIRNVNVVLTNISALERQGLVVMEPQQVTVNVEVTGKKSDLDRFLASSSSNINAYVDLSGYSEGQARVSVITSITNQTGGVTISDVNPKEILFTFEKVVTREIPVKINTIGELPLDYVLGDLSSRPHNVTISGPRTWVNEVQQVITEVDLTNRTDTTTSSFATVVVDDEGNNVRGVTREPNLVDITIPVFRTVSLPIELITVNELPENFSITNINITPSTIKVKGNNDIVNLQKLETVDIDINSMLDKSAIEVELKLPEGVELLNPNEKVTIIYNIEETITKEFNIPVRDLNILNLDNDLEVSEEDLSRLIRVELRGYKSILEPLINEQLKLSMDLLNLAEGRHDIELIIEEIQGVTVESITPQPLNITLINP